MQSRLTDCPRRDVLEPVSVGCFPSIASLTSEYPAMFSIPDVTFDALIVPVVMLLEPVAVAYRR
jgi:hypothetical protein